MTTTAIKQQKVRELPLILRALWFFVFGWNIGAVWIGIAWLMNVSIIGLPVGVWMLNRVPLVLTLKSGGGTYMTHEKSGQTVYKGKSQVPFLVRAIYFLTIGLWASFFWALIGFLLCLSIIGLPVGLLMLNRLPFVTTLGM